MLLMANFHVSLFELRIRPIKLFGCHLKFELLKLKYGCLPFGSAAVRVPIISFVPINSTNLSMANCHFMIPLVQHIFDSHIAIVIAIPLMNAAIELYYLIIPILGSAMTSCVSFILCIQFITYM